MSPVRIFSVPATASADRSSSAAITPFFSGVTRSAQPHRDHDPGRKIRLICGNTDSKRPGRVGMHGGSLRRRV